MATWAIGDIHGCFDSLQELWAEIDLDPAEDRLWLVGDLVNRGPKSLEVLRWAKRLSGLMGERMVVTLGNHDLHLLALDRKVNPARRLDTLETILEAPDRRELLDWLGSCSLLHRDDDFLLVHAGLLPHWSLEEAERKARALELALASSDQEAILQRQARAALGDTRLEDLRRSCHAFSLLRTCTEEGEPSKFSGPPEETPEGYHPWFELWKPLSRGITVVCGHWAALGLHAGPGILALDSGCVWGCALSAICLEDLRIVQQPTVEQAGDLP